MWKTELKRHLRSSQFDFIKSKRRIYIYLDYFSEFKKNMIFVIAIFFFSQVSKENKIISL